MKSLVLKENNKLMYADTNTPVPTRSEVLVKVISAGVCSSDIPRAFSNGAYFYPIILGHEIFGVSNNEKVVIYPLIPCHECSFCKIKQVNTCVKYDYVGSRRNGGFAEYVSVPQKNLIAVPKNLDPLLAAITEPTAVAVHASKKARPLNSDKILIIGDGPMGLTLGRYLVSQNYPNVYICVKHDYKGKIARDFSLRVIPLATDALLVRYNSFFDIVFEMAGADSAYRMSVAALKPHGRHRR